jgi:hypothetical protein
MNVRVAIVGIAVLVFSSAPARAQSAGEALNQLLFSPTGDYSGAALGLGPGQSVPDVLRQVLAAQTQTPPMSSSSSGLVFVFDPQTGLPRPASSSFGPLFAERAVTNGRGVFNIGVNFQRFNWRSYEGDDIRTGDAGLYWGHSDYWGDGWSYVGVCRMDMSTSVFTVSSNYGVTDRLDIGVALPIVRSRVQGSNEFVDFWVSPTGMVSDIFTSGRYESVDGRSTGLGDILARLKYTFWQDGPTSLAAGAELRLPTGNMEDLRGTGEFQPRFSFYASHDGEHIAPHANASLAIGGDSLYNEFTYVIGADVPAHDRVTVSGDLIGRFQSGFQGFENTGSFGPAMTVNGRNVQLAGFGVADQSWNMMVLATGAKVRVGAATLLTGNMLFPLNSQGLQPKVTATIGIERVIGR